MLGLSILVTTHTGEDLPITWAKRHFWKLHLEDDAVCYSARPLHGAASKAEDFNRLETAAPVARTGYVFVSFD